MSIPKEKLEVVCIDSTDTMQQAFKVRDLSRCFLTLKTIRNQRFVEMLLNIRILEIDGCQHLVSSCV
jgi:hypothetical protein